MRGKGVAAFGDGSVRARTKTIDKPGGLRWIAPMLATLADEPFSRRGWLFEPKFDGVRCFAQRWGNEVKLISRNDKQMNEKYPELVKAFRAQPINSFAIDGEIVTFDGDVTSFAKLQQRMQLEYPPAELQRKVPVWFYAFDLVYLTGRDTRQLPLRERKKLLRGSFEFKDPLRFTEHREIQGEAFFRQACRKGWEGIIAKNAESPYVSARSRDWLKFKCLNEQEFVIGGYTDPQGERVGFGALLVGYYDGKKLRYAGKVGTGYDTTTLRRLSSQLQKLEIRQSPFDSNEVSRRGVHWVRPDLVAEIAFGEWTKAGKLRQPRFLGLRSDKAPREVVREGKRARTR